MSNRGKILGDDVDPPEKADPRAEFVEIGPTPVVTEVPVVDDERELAPNIEFMDTEQHLGGAADGWVEVPASDD